MPPKKIHLRTTNINIIIAISPPSFMSSNNQKMGFLFVTVICIIVIISLFHFYCYQLRVYQTRTLDIEQQLQEHQTMQLLAEIIRQRQTTTTQSNNSTEGEEPSSAVMTVAYKVKDEAGSYCCCAICIEEFEDEEICGVVESCGHCFHKDCMDQWLRIESRCPLCRCLVHAVSHDISNSQENEA